MGTVNSRIKDEPICYQKKVEVYKKNHEDLKKRKGEMLYNLAMFSLLIVSPTTPVVYEEKCELYKADVSLTNSFGLMLANFVGFYFLWQPKIPKLNFGNKVVYTWVGAFGLNLAYIFYAMKHRSEVEMRLVEKYKGHFDILEKELS